MHLDYRIEFGCMLIFMNDPSNLLCDIQLTSLRTLCIGNYTCSQRGGHRIAFDR